MKSNPIRDQGPRIDYIAKPHSIYLEKHFYLRHIGCCFADFLYNSGMANIRQYWNWIYLWFFMSAAIWHFNLVWKYSTGSTIKTLTPKV